MDDAPGADDWITDRRLKGEVAESLIGSRRADSVGVYEDMT
jgi:hypothetical protein